MKSIALVSGVAPVVASLLLTGCAGTPTGLGTPSAFPARDLKPVDLTTGTATFIVSLNDDDDNANKKADLREALVPATDDNVRELVFHHPTADAVYVADIIDLTKHASVVGTKVRAYQANLRAPFAFNTTHPTAAANPLKLCLEGIKTSDRKDEFGFEYAYYLNGQPLGAGGFVVGTVVDVNASLAVDKGAGTAFAKHRKMLITAVGKARGAILPQGAAGTEWTYDKPATLVLATPKLPDTLVTADLHVTPNPDQDLLRFKVQGNGHEIEAHFPVNVTAPLHTEITNGHTGFTLPTGWVNANRGKVDLFPVFLIDYRILDQFRQPIKDSAYAGRIPQIRENIGHVMTSPLRPIQAWIANRRRGLQWSPDWTDHTDGTFTDHIEATGLDKDMLIAPVPGNPGQRAFDPGLQAIGGVLLELSAPHVWQLSVSGKGIAAGTANTFSTTVTDTRPQGGGIQIKFTSTYQAAPQ